MNNLLPLHRQLDCRKASYLMIDRHRLLQSGSVLTPHALEVQPTFRCNYKCPHCAYHKRNESWIDELSYDDMISIELAISKLKIKLVYISGAGEPLVKSYVGKELSSLRATGAQLVLITNGSLVSHISTDSLRSLKYMQVSIPSTDKDLYQEITGVDTLDKILDIPSMVKGRCGTLSPQLTAMFVITPLNFNEVPQAVKVIKDAGYDFLRFRLADDLEGSTTVLSDQELNEIKLLVKGVDYSPEFTNLASAVNRFDKEATLLTRCAFLDLGLLVNIDPSGEVYRCTVDIGTKEFSLGNIHNDTLPNLWFSQKHLNLVDILQQRYSQGKCSSCCRGHRYNALFGKLVDNLPDWEADSCPAI